jgi:hypothetical protein
MNNIGKTSADAGMYNTNSFANQNPWSMNIPAPGGDYTQDLTWLI